MNLSWISCLDGEEKILCYDQSTVSVCLKCKIISLFLSLISSHKTLGILDSATRVRILIDAASISHSANTPGKARHPTIPSQIWVNSRENWAF